MLTIAEGSAGDVAAWFDSLPAEPGELRLRVDAADGVIIPMGGARELLAQLRAVVGDAAVERAMASERAVLSLVLRRLVPQLDEGERRCRELASALVLGALPNTGLHARPVVEAFAALFAALLNGRRVQLLFTDALGLDPGSLAVVRSLLRRLGPECGLAVTLGVDVVPKEGEAIAVRRAQLNQVELTVLRALPIARVIQVAPSMRTPPGRPLSRPLIDALDDNHERAAYQALAAAPDPVPPVVTALVTESVRTAFGCFGFATALDLAQRLLSRAANCKDSAELHTLAGLSAVNLASPWADGEDTLVRLASEHLNQALAVESNAQRRIHLLYRMCIRAARKEGNFTEALEHGRRGIELARSGELTPALAAYLEAWCHNARAYSLFRLARSEEAAADCEAALALLDRCNGAPELPPVEVMVARFHLLNNLSRVAYESGDRARAHRCQDESLACEAAIPLGRRTFYRWYNFELDLDDLDLAAARYRARLDEAHADWAPHLESLYAQDLAALEYRRGDAPAAFALFATAHRLAGALGHDPEQLRSSDLNCAVAAYRAGLLDEAAERFARLVQDPALAESDAASEIHSALAMVAASAGDPIRARNFAVRARASANAAGDAGVTARVGRWVGEAWLLLGYSAEARDTFAQALRANREDPAAAPEDRLGLLLGLYAAGDTSQSLVGEALVLAPAALADANAWWELPRLLAAAAQLDAETLAEPPVRAATLVVARQAAQRTDCAAVAKMLEARL